MRVQTIALLASKFKNDNRGAVAVIFALMLVPLLALIGFALDYSRYNTQQARMQQAVDSAVLAADKAPQNQKTTVATAFFNGNFKGDFAPASSQFTVDSSGHISGTATSTIPMPFASFAKLSSANVTISAASTPGTTPTVQYNAEVAMMIDLTGSMGATVNGATKISGLKSAGLSILDILFGSSSTSSSVKVAVAPFADYVNAGPYAVAATGLPATGAYNNITNLASTKQGPFSGAYTGSVIGSQAGSQAGATSASSSSAGATFNGNYCSNPTVTTASTYTGTLCSGSQSRQVCTNYTWPVASQYSGYNYSGSSYGNFWIYNANSSGCRNAWCYGTAYYTPTTTTTTVPGCESANANTGPLITCVTERTASGHQYDDTSPSTGGYVGPYNKSASGTTNKVNYSSDGKCHVAGRELPQVIPLTNTKSTLTTFFNNMTVGGGTPGHIGTAWGWYLLSPNWSSIWPSSSTPAAYTSTTTKKYAILMTDGEYNEQYSSVASKTQALSLCTNMKSQGITVYTVGFGFSKTAKPNDGSTDGAALGTLQSCASANSTFFYPYDAAALQTSFQNIGNAIIAGNTSTTTPTPGALTQ